MQLINLYLETYRPVLLAGPSPYLFLGPSDRPKSCERIALQITTYIRERCRLQVHLHLCRHIAAKLYLDAHPSAYGVVCLLHGHCSVETTTRFYCGMETAATMRRFDEHVLELHERLAKPTPGRKRARL